MDFINRKMAIETNLTELRMEDYIIIVKQVSIDVEVNDSNID